MMTLASTYMLYGHNFRERIEVAKKLKKRSEILSFSITRLGRLQDIYLVLNTKFCS